MTEDPSTAGAELVVTRGLPPVNILQAYLTIIDRFFVMFARCL